MCDYKAACARLDAICRSISEMVLVEVEKKKIYQHTEFATLQEQHHAKVWHARNLGAVPTQPPS